MKLLIAGETNVHLQNYCKAIYPYVSTMSILTETEIDIPSSVECKVVSFRSSSFWNWFRHYRQVTRFIKDTSPDIIHLHQVNRLALVVTLVADRLKIPIVTTAWGSDVLLVPFRNAIYRALTKRVLRSSRKVTADAHVMIDAMMKLVADDLKYIWLQYGIDPVNPMTKEKIIYSNRLHRPLYNIDTIIRDFAAFVSNHPDWRMVLGATGPETDRLISLAAELGCKDKIEFTGWLDKAANEVNYARASIYVSIPSSDGTSVSLLEALSADCIPVVSDIPVTKEWIQDGVNGVVRKEGVNPFEEALTLNRETCCAFNRKHITEKVDRRFTTAAFFRIYNEVMSSR